MPDNKSFWISTAFPSCIDDVIREALEEQKLKLKFRQEILGVPQIKINTENFNIDYFKQPWVICNNYIKPFSMVKLEKETNKMEAKKCDRCGKLYEQNEDRPSVRFKFKEVYGTEDLNEAAIAKRQLQEVHIKAYSTELDLCPECKESFKKWWESDDKK